MKNLTRFCQFILLAIIAVACNVTGADGPPGPRGPQGPQGNDGVDGESAYVFEFNEVTFTSSNNYELFLEFPQDFVVNTDNVLVYFLWDYIEEDDLDVWRPLPQTLFTQFGTLVYNFDFSRVDVRLFMDGNFDLNSLGADATDDWIVRVVVIPSNSEARTTTNIDYDNYHEVIKHYGLKESTARTNVKRLE